MKAHFKFLTLALVSSVVLSGCMATAGGVGRNGGGMVSVNNGGGQGARSQGQQQLRVAGQPYQMVQGGQQMYASAGQPYQMVQGGQQYQVAPSQPIFIGSDGSVRTMPCQPFQADGLMQWAQGTGGTSQHSRSAQVTTSNGYVNCHTSESASSSASRTVK